MSDIAQSMEVDEDDVDMSVLPVPTGWRILIQPLKVKEKTSGGIALPDQAMNAEEHLRYVGKVIAMGHLCYQNEKFKQHNAHLLAPCEPWCKVGDYVAYGQYAGQQVSVRAADGLEKYKLVNDDEILAVIPDPNAILAYV
jgi:co-chaperonin GroES (HSP10)